MNKDGSMTKVLLYSGGTDSWLINQLWKPDNALYVDMRTMYSEEEFYRAVKNPPKQFSYTMLPLGRYEDKDTAFIPMRNMFLLMMACYAGEYICLGATKEDEGGSSDKDLNFLNEAEALLNRLWKPQSLFKGKEIKICKYFITKTKDELIQQYLDQGGDINKFKNETFSCYKPTRKGEECLSCKACFRKFIVCYKNGATYSLEEKEKMYHFAEKNVVNRSNHAQGRYFLDKPNGQQVLNVLQSLYKELGKELVLT